MGIRAHVTHNKEVRFHLDGEEDGERWITVQIHDGALHLRGVDGLTLQPGSANTLLIRVVES